jgi:hypothetical protein
MYRGQISVKEDRVNFIITELQKVLDVPDLPGRELRPSVSLPIECGLGQLQLFTKAVRGKVLVPNVIVQQMFIHFVHPFSTRSAAARQA